MFNNDKDKPRKRAVVLAESKPDDKGGRDQAFVEEGRNLQEFYQKQFPDTDLEILPFYGQKELDSVREKLQGVDDVFLFGHSGGQLGGVEHDKIANMLKESGTKSCYGGVCSFEKYAEPYKSLPNFSYRGEGSWYGVDKRQDNILHAMFSKAYTGNPNDYYGAGTVSPVRGQHYNKTMNRQPESPIEFNRQDLIRHKPLGNFIAGR